MARSSVQRQVIPLAGLHIEIQTQSGNRALEGQGFPVQLATAVDGRAEINVLLADGGRHGQLLAGGPDLALSLGLPLVMGGDEFAALALEEEGALRREYFMLGPSKTRGKLRVFVFRVGVPLLTFSMRGCISPLTKTPALRFFWARVQSSLSSDMMRLYMALMTSKSASLDFLLR
jgi:hypothetical protein